MEKQSHYIAALFYFFGEILPIGDKKNPVWPLGRNLKKELWKHSLYFIEKKKEKKEEFARFRQQVCVAHLDLGRIAEKTLLSA
jgi:hypothetical protein